jgi:serine/threonine protein kinase
MGREGVVHGNLSPTQILLKPNGDLTLTTPQKLPKPSPYTAPELLKNHPASHNSDLWSLGCIICKMHGGRVPGVEEI